MRQHPERYRRLSELAADLESPGEWVVKPAKYLAAGLEVDPGIERASRRGRGVLEAADGS
jgi:hypothetical protein